VKVKTRLIEKGVWEIQTEKGVKLKVRAKSLKASEARQLAVLADFLSDRLAIIITRFDQRLTRIEETLKEILEVLSK